MFQLHKILTILGLTVVASGLSSAIYKGPLKFRPRGWAEPKQEWSYVDVRKGAHMFYWLYHTTAPGGIQQAPLIMWLQGGPGGSGTGFGNFEEIGPLDVQQNPRNTTWLQAASLLFVDNPVGTGYSYADSKEYFTHDVAGITADMMVVLKTFFMEKSPQFQEVPFYIFSESYGGKMTAAISQALYKNIQAGNISCNFKGLAMGDSWISPADSTATWAPYLYTNSLVDQAGYKAINDSVKKVLQDIAAGQWSEATGAWGSTQTVVDLQTNGVNFYNILKWGQQESSSRFTGNSIGDWLLSKLHAESLDDLMNNEIREKLGIIPKQVKWGGQSNEVFETQSEDFMKPVVDIVDDLIQNTNLKVVVYSGQLDLIVDTIGTEQWVYTLSIADKYREASRKPILDPVSHLTSGFVKTVDNFSFYWILDAGHMVPSDNGATALKMVRMITGLED
ncbi:retinoid-inducible serine carboxypeptidase-like [Mya arenaria]|uniref:retinoid-inducible serine carboxypeptidase-like n=1 Tax=Mya arenaria TaxID=6604 RepID=UPI0022DF6156|nr:retinoid-inducible serine carboxypeptidase-like [Mya arenaria]